MIEGIPRISVLVITYNQEDVIDRTMKSLLSQKDYIYEICVSDDCSKDRTWNILRDYSVKYPGLFVLNRNEPNVGIFENIEKTWSMPSGDIIYQLAGDDECGDGWFKKVIEFVISSGIDIKNDSFCIYGDYKFVHLNGSSTVFKNSMVLKGIDPVHLALRWKIVNRGCCFSKNVLKKFQPVSRGRSHIAETAQDRQLQLFSENVYYIESVGNVYYGEIGISSKVYKDETLFQQRIAIMPYAESYLNSQGYFFSKKDCYLTDYVQSIDYYNRNNSLRNKIRLIYYTIRIFDSEIDTIKEVLRSIISILMH